QHGRGNVFLLLTDSKGGVVLVESTNPDVVEKMRQGALSSDRTYRIAVTGGSGDGDSIAVRVRKTALPDGNVLSVGDNVTNDERHARWVLAALIATSVLILVVGGIVGVMLARRFAAPLGLMAKAARRIERGDYSVRISDTSESLEIADLEGAFNKMCGEIEKTLTELRVLTENMAHDLRTPLTRLKAAAELHAMGVDSTGNLAENVMEETDAMLAMINMMLEISQTEYGVTRTPTEEIDLVTFLKEMLELYSALADDKGIALDAQLPSGRVLFRGHRGRLQQMVGNLLDNAVKFTPGGGSVVVRLTAAPLALEVENSGPGIEAKDVPHVFKRFWRADSSRSHQGNGLGLALVKAIAESYGGSVSCASVPGRTTTLRIVLK
ncbi:MAG: HAMP domain-containing protein, partial [Kiritimatiellae bacterium]|nr:HAMP domain-containing protein [Kiritimatiellia bacterium]